MVDITEISAIVAAAGVLVGVVFTVLQLRDLVKTRQTDLVMRLYSIFGTTEHMEAYNDIVAMDIRDYDEMLKRTSEQRTKMMSACAFYEGIGVLLHRKLIDIGLVDDLFSTLNHLQNLSARNLIRAYIDHVAYVVGAYACQR